MHHGTHWRLLLQEGLGGLHLKHERGLTLRRHNEHANNSTTLLEPLALNKMRAFFQQESTCSYKAATPPQTIKIFHSQTLVFDCNTLKHVCFIHSALTPMTLRLSVVCVFLSSVPEVERQSAEMRTRHLEREVFRPDGEIPGAHPLTCFDRNRSRVQLTYCTLGRFTTNE